MRYRLPIVVLVLVLASTVAKSQVRDFSASPTSPTPPAIGGPDERITVLEGQVVSEAGFAPGESVTVVLECESHASMRAHSDARGNFSLMLTEADGGHGRGILRTQAGTSAFPLADCELYGELSGYRSEHIRLPDSRDGGIVQVGVISLHPVSPEHGSSVSVTSLAAPEKAKKSLQKGQQQAKKGKWAGGGGGLFQAGSRGLSPICAGMGRAGAYPSAAKQSCGSSTIIPPVGAARLEVSGRLCRVGVPRSAAKTMEGTR